jgi:hypothetical protein
VKIHLIIYSTISLFLVHACTSTSNLGDFQDISHTDSELQTENDTRLHTEEIEENTETEEHQACKAD